jgi:hypothetical protein
MNDNFITAEMMAENSKNKSKIVEILLKKEPSSTTYQDNINNLPRDIHDKIVEHYKKLMPSKYVLRDWVPKDKLDWFALSGNPYASEILMEQADYENSLTEEEYDALDKNKKISWMRLCRNQKSIDIFNKYPSKILWAYLSNNDYQPIVDMVIKRFEYEKKNPSEIDEDNRVSINDFSDNKNPQIMELVKERVEYEKGLSPEDYDMLEVTDVLDWCYLTENPSAIDILKENPGKIVWSLLSNNTNPLAIDLLRERAVIENNMSKKAYNKLGNKIDWYSLSINANAIELLKEYPHKIKWGCLSANPAAIDLLKENSNAIDWVMLSENPNAIEMLKKKPTGIYHYDFYTGLCTNPNAIDDFYTGLCTNPNAIEILKENKDLIIWKYLSGNPNALELIKERAEYESTLKPEEYWNLGSNNRLDWKELSKHKTIFMMV